MESGPRAASGVSSRRIAISTPSISQITRQVRATEQHHPERQRAKQAPEQIHEHKHSVVLKGGWIRPVAIVQLLRQGVWKRPIVCAGRTIKDALGELLPPQHIVADPDCRQRRKHAYEHPQRRPSSARCVNHPSRTTTLTRINKDEDEQSAREPPDTTSCGPSRDLQTKGRIIVGKMWSLIHRLQSSWPYFELQR